MALCRCGCARSNHVSFGSCKTHPKCNGYDARPIEQSVVGNASVGLYSREDLNYDLGIIEQARHIARTRATTLDEATGRYQLGAVEFERVMAGLDKQEQSCKFKLLGTIRLLRKDLKNPVTQARVDAMNRQLEREKPNTHQRMRVAAAKG